MWLAAGMAVASAMQSHSQRKAAMRAKVADAKLQRARLERARQRKTDDYVANSQKAREAAQDREVQIESNRIDAESRVDTTFAGSGISGQSLNDLDAELNASVVKNKIESKRALDDQLGALSRDYSQSMEDSAFESQGIDTTAVKGNFLSEVAGAAQGFSSGMSAQQDISKAWTSVSSKMGF